MDGFTEDVLRRAIALILGDCGWSRSDTTCLEVLAGVMKDFLLAIIRKAGNMAYLCNKSQLEASHVLYALRSCGLHIGDLQEHMSLQPSRSLLRVPSYPVRPKYRAPMQVVPKDISEYIDSASSEDSEAGIVMAFDENSIGEPLSSSEVTDVEPEYQRKSRKGKETVLEKEVTDIPPTKNKSKKKHKCQGKHKKSKKNCKCRKHK